MSAMNADPPWARMHRVGSGLPSRYPGVVKHQPLGWVAATGENLAWHRPGFEVEP